MSTFEESLKKTVLGIGQEYSRTVRDLVEETNSVSDSVHRVTNGLAQLLLKTDFTVTTGTYFSLNVKDTKTFSEVGAFFVKSNGYPVKVASSVIEAKGGIWETELYSRADIRKYFEDLASNSESRLTLRVAFLIRQEEDRPERM
jgi:hypothetical protein